MSSKNLSTILPEELQAFLDSFDNVLCDCDGTVWRAGNPIPRVAETLDKLRRLNKTVRFVSNNYIDDIAIPTLAVVEYLKKINFDKEMLILGSPSMVQEFQNAGFKVKTVEDVTFTGLDELKHEIEDDGNVGAVIADLDVNINYIKLVKAVVYLTRDDVIYIAAGTDLRIPFGIDRLLIPGPKHFQHILQDLTKRIPVGMGKPEQNFNQFLVKKFNITEPSRTLFVGDALEQDIGFAKQSGYRTLLVLSGITMLEHLTACKKQEFIPDYYIKSLGDLDELIANNQVVDLNKN